MDTFEYCVAIRTLGKAGEKYQALLNSIQKQTIQPKKILVYIAEGYPLPKETIGTEQYIKCPKGMITQRSLPFVEIDTEYTLFCDDDICFPVDFVKKLYDALIKSDSDCVSPHILGPEVVIKYNGSRLIRGLMTYEFPRRDDGWAVKVMRNGSFTYNPHHQEIMPTESAPGACLFIKIDAFHAIHFEDERWLEKMKYPIGEDLLFYYKLFINGYKVAMVFNTGIRHLDAGTGRTNLPKGWYRKTQMIWFIIPYRMRYNLKNISKTEKLKCICSYLLKMTEQFLVLPLRIIHHKRISYLLEFFKGIQDGYRYVHSEEYKKIPFFDAYHK